MSDRNARLFDETVKRVDQIVDIYKKDSKRMDSLASDMRDQIVKRTRLGKGVSENGSSPRLKRLSQSYKEQRRGNVRYFRNKSGGVFKIEKKEFILSNKELNAYRASKEARSENRKNRDIFKTKELSKKTTPSKSNLTATGLMLDSVRGKNVGGKIIIDIVDKKGTDLYGSPNNTTTNEKANFQAKQNRRFLDLAKFEVKMFANRIADEFIEISKQIFKDLSAFK